MFQPISIRLAFAALTILFLTIPSMGSAQEKEDFTDDRFASLQDAGAVVLIDVFAEWCPTCAQQQEILAAYQEENPDAELHILTVDFDDRKDLVRRFQAPRQSTFILYRGEERIWFSVAETRRDEIFARLDAALADG